MFGVLKGGLKRFGAAVLGRVRPVVLVERQCRGWPAKRDVTCVLRAARQVEAGRLQCQPIAPRVRKEDDAILEEVMFPCTLCGCKQRTTTSGVTVALARGTFPTRRISHPAILTTVTGPRFMSSATDLESGQGAQVVPRAGAFLSLSHHRPLGQKY